MDDYNNPPEPTESIEIGPQHTELIIDRQIWSNRNISENYCLSGRFIYFPDLNLISIFDLFLGTEKKIFPKTDGDFGYIKNYVELSANRAFVIYEKSTRKRSHSSTLLPIYAAILSIDFDDESYQFIDNVLLKSGMPLTFSICHPIVDTVMFTNLHETNKYQYSLNILKLNASYSKILERKLIDISLNHRYFHIIDGKIVFANLNRTNLIQHITSVKCFMYINHNGDFVEIENTGASLKPRLPFYMTDVGAPPFITDWRWHGSTLFYSYVIYDITDRQGDLPAPFMWIFKMQTREWFKLDFQFSLNVQEYRFDVDSEGVMSIIKYRRNRYNESQPYETSLVRVVLKSPEKLITLCLFKARNVGLSINIPNYSTDK